MARTTLVWQFLERVSRTLHDISPQFSRWTQSELVLATNDGQMAIAKYLPYSCSRVDSIRLLPGSRQYIGSIPSARVIPGDGSSAADISGVFLQDLIRNMGTDGATPGRPIRITDREVLDTISPNWHTTVGTSIRQYVFDPRNPTYFWVSPAVHASQNVWVEMSMLVNPSPIADGAGVDYSFESASSPTLLSIDDKYVDDLMSYVLARAYMKDSDFAMDANNAAFHGTTFVNSINAQAAALTGVNPNLKSLPFSPNVPLKAS